MHLKYRMTCQGPLLPRHLQAFANYCQNELTQTKVLNALIVKPLTISGKLSQTEKEIGNGE